MIKYLSTLVRIGIAMIAVVLFTQCEAGVTGNESPNTVQPTGGTAACQASTVDVCHYLQTNYPVEALSEAEIQALIFMREEEKLALDVYTAMASRWNHQVFANIAKSERKHQEMTVCLMDKYDLPDVSAGNEPGVFTNPDLQQLYNNLMTQGNQSLEQAFVVGATIEDVDIRDLQVSAGNTDNADLKAVFAELERGSRNHIRAFTSQLERLGSSYTATYITAEELQTILSTPKERGGLLCNDQAGCNAAGAGGNCGGSHGGNGQGQNGGNCHGQGTGTGNGGNCPSNGNGGNGNGGNGGNGNGNGGNGNGHG